MKKKDFNINILFTKNEFVCRLNNNFVSTHNNRFLGNVKYASVHIGHQRSEIYFFYFDICLSYYTRSPILCKVNTVNLWLENII